MNKECCQVIEATLYFFRYAHRFLWIFSKQLEAVCPQFTVNANPAIFIICFTEGLERQKYKTHFLQTEVWDAVVHKGCSGIEFAEYWNQWYSNRHFQIFTNWIHLSNILLRLNLVKNPLCISMETNESQEDYRPVHLISSLTPNQISLKDISSSLKFLLKISLWKNFYFIIILIKRKNMFILQVFKKVGCCIVAEFVSSLFLSASQIGRFHFF